MAGNNRALKEARKKKDDEFYTTYEAIEDELKHYGGVFEGKVVYCPCDDYRWSEFVHYFRDNFKRLGLKELIATNYDIGEGSYIYSYKGGGVDISIKHSGKGSYREFDRLLERCDIVCTNPPFSLFREFVDALITYGKKFLIIGNKNAITYKEIFTLIKDNKLWLGFTSPKGFDQPSTHEVKQMAGLTRWFTNIEHRKRQTPLYLREEASVYSIEYPKYDNYDAINVDDVKMIPHDYDGVMGVPITFLDKYCPTQFEIIGMSSSAGYTKEIVGLPLLKDGDARPLIDRKNTYARIFIRKVKSYMAEISRIELNPTEKEFLVEQFRDMLDQAHTVRMVQIANLDNVSIDAMLSSGTTVPSAFHTKPEWPSDFPVIRRREILITVDEIVEKRNW